MRRFSNISKTIEFIKLIHKNYKFPVSRRWMNQESFWESGRNMKLFNLR